MLKVISRLLVLTLPLATAHAGTVLEASNRDLANKRADTTTLSYAQDGKMRVESKPDDGMMIFKDDTIYTINTKEKTYIVMDRAAVKRMAEQINPALKQMQEQMAKMPPEQRAQMERMMGQHMPGMGKEKAQEIRKTGRSDKIGGHSCSYVEVHEDGALADELCIASPSVLKGSQDLLHSAMKLSALLKEMLDSIDAPWLKQMIDRQVDNYDKIGGIPVLSRHYMGGKPASETTLKSIRSESLPASMFEVPAGYTKKDIMAQR